MAKVKKRLDTCTHGNKSTNTQVKVKVKEIK